MKRLFFPFSLNLALGVWGILVTYNELVLGG